MTCSFCGSILDDDEIECPYCGHKTGVGTARASYAEPAQPEEDFEPVGQGAYTEDEYIEENSGEEQYGEDYRDDGYQDDDYRDGTEEESFEPEQPRRRPSAGNAAANAGTGKGKAKGKAGFAMPKLDLKGGLDKLKKAGAAASAGASARKSSEAGGRASSVKKNPAMINLIILGACALLSIISLISVISLSNKVDSNQQTMLSQLMQMQNNEQQLASQISEISNKVGNVSTTIAEQSTSKSITITKQPTSTATYLGRGGDQDSTQNVPIFTVTATGYDLTFTWQRFDDASGSWIDLVFDADSNNPTYGLHIYTDVSKGYSELAAHGVNSDAYGSYRCQIADAYGTKSTDTVILSERSNA